MPVADADRGFFQNNQDGSITLVGLNECTSLSSTLFVLMIVRHAIVKNDISVHDNGQLKFLLEGLGHSKVGNVNEQAIENDIKQCQDGSTNENFLDWLDEYDFEVVDSGTWETSGGLESGRSELGVLKDLKDLLKKHPGKAGAAGMVFKLALKYEISTTHESTNIADYEESPKPDGVQYQLSMRCTDLTKDTVDTYNVNIAERDWKKLLGMNNTWFRIK